MTAAIEVEGLGKRYELGARAAGHNVREAIMAALAAPFRARPPRPEIWALRDVSFSVEEGEVLGVVGKNGAGKSTLLRVLSRITEPTKGHARIRGRVASLLEVGTGFHHELSGRENIFLNGAILGMKRREIQRKFDEIVEFSEIERFLDTPVKHYSSGMYMRLAFSVAAHLEPEILMVDEVLAVGDIAFQKKSLGKMGQVARSGRTVLFVSHNMAAVSGLCDRAIVLHDGTIHDVGPAPKVVASYLSAMNAGTIRPTARADAALAIEAVVLENDAGQPTSTFASLEPVTVEVKFVARSPIERPYFLVGFQSPHSTMFQASMIFDGHRPSRLEGAGTISVRFRMPYLLPQTYVVWLQVKGADAITDVVSTDVVGSFQVTGRPAEFGLVGEMADHYAQATTPLVLPYSWRLPDGKVVEVEPRARAQGGPS